MEKENWKKVEEVVQEALAIDGERRLNFLDRKFGDFPELQEEIESLLNSEDSANEFFESPAAVRFSSVLGEDREPTDIGEKIGNYQILDELGIGGMGAVYLAKRIDGEFDQKVAIKMLRREFNTETIRQRFENEKEIQAALNHPNIARLLDSGTSDGVPYLVMEYIEGENIRNYCVHSGLSLNKRLKIFNKVCDAVSFAHRNLVVHRDLKPSNIIVTKEGVPKLLDFGISKLLREETDSTQTVTRLGAMTPEYASPEQIEGKSVSTSTDIYSLGVILYELLTGQTPFGKQVTEARDLREVVCNKSPVKPSEVSSYGESPAIGDSGDVDGNHPVEGRENVVTNLPNQVNTKPTNTKTTRQIAPADAKKLRGDLDNIVLKALRKEPERRYQTVERFSTDIWNYLDGMPVSARPATFSYKTSKFISRNKIGVFVSSLVLFVIIGGAFATLWQARVAQAERLKAEKRFGDVRSLANSILFDVYPTVEKLEGSIEARKQIVENALKYLDSLSKEAADNSELQLELADAYKKIGDVQGNDKVPNLGNRKGSLESYGKAKALIQRVYEKDRKNLEVRNSLADAIEKEGFVFWWSGDNSKTFELYDEALSLRKELIEENPESAEYKRSLASLYLDYGDVPYWENKNSDALEKYQIAYDIIEKLARENPQNNTIQKTYAHSHNRISKVDLRLAKYEKAIQHLNTSLGIYKEIARENPNDQKMQKSLWVTQFSICEVYLFEKNSVDAVKFCPEIIATQQRFVELEPNNATAKYNLSNSYYYLAEAYFLAKEFDKALASLEKGKEFLQIIQEKKPTNLDYKHHDLAILKSKARVYKERGKLDAANVSFKDYVRRYEVLLKENPKDSRTKLSLFKGYYDLAEISLAKNDVLFAKEFYKKSYLLGQELNEKKALSEEDKKTFGNVRSKLNKVN